MKRSKRYNKNSEILEKGKEYSLDEAIDLMKQCAPAKFDETVDVALRLGVDPRHSDQMIRGAVSLPHGLGKTVRVLVLTKGAKEKEAQDAGADYVGLDEYLDKIQEGWFEFDVIVATPDVMGNLGKFGKILGPKGLMPNPKSGTVTFDVGKAVQEVKAGKIDFRVDRTGIVHVAVGKVSFENQKIRDNIKTFIETIIRMKPATAKGQYLRSATISSTMGPGIHLDRSLLLEEVK
ncbi:50S ribosomal protein L1 [candidate division KSB1 bacterium]|nr:50S ribosomal protein L1 [candidate division KSB1 bacterium]RQV93917.1 MAG: 50S ribosomal protein L1 [bacterium]